MKGQVVYFSHGGGPMPLLGEPSHEAMIDFMKKLPEKLARPEAILVFSAHWEEDVVHIQSSKKPGLFYDYYGFPKETYEIEYPCSTNPVLSERIASLLTKAGIKNTLDEKRAYDHGVFIPLLMMYEDADIPVIQISLLKNLSPEQHYNIGVALRPLMQENILVIGSGFSFHNMRAFQFDQDFSEDLDNEKFQDKLEQVCCTLSGDKRREELIHWKEFPAARYCHPREEHLIPLHICAGFSDKEAIKIFDAPILGKRALGFQISI